MALSGAFTGTSGNQYIFPTIKWSAVQSVDGNYSDVTATLYYSRTNSGYTTTGTWSGGITINGSRTSGSRYLEIYYQSGTLAISATVRVYHDADGSKSVTISADGAISGTSLSSTSISATVTLNTIPRASAISVPELTMGKAGTITITPAVSGFRHTLRYVFGMANGTIATKTAATSVSWTPAKNLATQIPNNTVGIGRVYCDTYNGDTLIGTSSQQVYITVSDDAVPAISSFTVSDAIDGISAKFGAYVQGKSALAVRVAAAGIYGSTITKYETVVQSVTYKGDAFTSDVLTESGTLSITTTVTDSRGRSSKSIKSITVLPYSPPTINAFSAWRITNAGVTSDDGNRLAVKMGYTVAAVGGKNDRTYKLKYRKSTDEDFTQFASGTAATEYDGTQNFANSPDISTDYAYVIQLEISDFFQTVTFEIQIPTAFTIMDFHSTGRGMAIGKVSEKDALEVAMDADFTGSVRLSGSTQVAALAADSVDVAGDVTVSGSLSVDDNTINDMVIEQGTSGAWTYRKWSSGIAECWRDHVGQPDVSNTWGALYESQRFGPLNFPPGLFSDAPRVLMVVSGTTGANCIGLEIEGQPTATQSAMWYYLRAAKNTVTMTVTMAVHAIGRWK